MHMGWPEGVTILRGEKPSHNAVSRNRIADRLHRTEPERAVSFSDKLSPEVHIWLVWVLILVETFRRTLPYVDFSAGHRIALALHDFTAHKHRSATDIGAHDRFAILDSRRMQPP